MERTTYKKIKGDHLIILSDDIITSSSISDSLAIIGCVTVVNRQPTVEMSRQVTSDILRNQKLKTVITRVENNRHNAW